mgnify:CR=1 FL=1
MLIKYVNFKAPVKKFKKVKETGDVEVISRITFECGGMDDETLMLLTQLSDSGQQVSVDIQSAMLPVGG